jgi:hypothetical protein
MACTWATTTAGGAASFLPAPVWSLLFPSKSKVWRCHLLSGYRTKLRAQASGRGEGRGVGRAAGWAGRRPTAPSPREAAYTTAPSRGRPATRPRARRRASPPTTAATTRPFPVTLLRFPFSNTSPIHFLGVPFKTKICGVKFLGIVRRPPLPPHPHTPREGEVCRRRLISTVCPYSATLLLCKLGPPTKVNYLLPCYYKDIYESISVLERRFYCTSLVYSYLLSNPSCPVPTVCNVRIL